MKDALGNDVIVGKNYGYSTSNNGIVTIVTGNVDKVENLKATLSNIYERYGAYGQPGEFDKKDRRRSVYTCSLFPTGKITETLANIEKLAKEKWESNKDNFVPWNKLSLISKKLEIEDM